MKVPVNGERPPGPHVEERTNSTRAGRAGGVRPLHALNPHGPRWLDPAVMRTSA